MSQKNTFLRCEINIYQTPTSMFFKLPFNLYSHHNWLHNYSDLCFLRIEIVLPVPLSQKSETVGNKNAVNSMKMEPSKTESCLKRNPNLSYRFLWKYCYILIPILQQKLSKAESFAYHLFSHLSSFYCSE